MENKEEREKKEGRKGDRRTQKVRNLEGRKEGRKLGTR